MKQAAIDLNETKKRAQAPLTYSTWMNWLGTKKLMKKKSKSNKKISKLRNEMVIVTRKNKYINAAIHTDIFGLNDTLP